MDEGTPQARKALIESLLKKEYVQLLFDHDRVVRSHIIYEATDIDGMIADMIASHFCADQEKHLSFKGLMFNTAEVSFSKKIEILGKLLKSHYSDILKDIPGLIKKLNSLRKSRNEFAHAELVLDQDKFKEMPVGITLRSIDRNGEVDEKFISSSDADKLVRSAQTLKWYVFYVWLEVQHRTKGEASNQFKGVLDAIKSGAWDAAANNLSERRPAQARIEEAAVAPESKTTRPNTIKPNRST